MRGVVGTWPETEVMEALGLQSHSVTWHHPRWGEKPAGLGLGDMVRRKKTKKQKSLVTGLLRDNYAVQKCVVVKCALTKVKYTCSSFGCII